MILINTQQPVTLYREGFTTSCMCGQENTNTWKNLQEIPMHHCAYHDSEQKSPQSRNIWVACEYTQYSIINQIKKENLINRLTAESYRSKTRIAALNS